MDSKPLLKALNNLPKLTTLDVASSTAAKHPFLMTTPRLFAIQRSSPHLENLTVQFMKGGEAGDSDEEDEMWERADGEEEQPEEPAGERASEQKGKEKSEGVNKKETKRKGLKTFSLYDFDVSSAEISLILRDVSHTSRCYLNATDSSIVPLVDENSPNARSSSTRFELYSFRFRFYHAHLRTFSHFPRPQPP